MQGEFPINIFLLLDELRDSGYSIGMDDYLRLEKLFIKLIDQGALPEDARGLEKLIAPIVCISGEQQRDFSIRFYDWISTNSAVEAGRSEQVNTQSTSQIDTDKPPASLLKRIVHMRRMQVIIWVLLCVFVPLAGYFAFTQDNGPIVTIQPTNAAETPVIQETLGLKYATIILGAALAIALIGLIKWKWRQRNRYLKRFQANKWFSIKSFFVEGVTSQLFGQEYITELALQLRRHRPVENAYYLNIDRTIECTISNQGFFSPSYDNIMDRPKYLLLIDRASARDHQAYYFDTLVTNLRNNDVDIEKFYFDKDPRSCYCTRLQGAAFTLEQLHVLFPNHKLLVFSQAHYLVDLVREKIKPWAAKLSDWENAYIITLKPAEAWGESERIIINDGLTLLPEQGLSMLDIVAEINATHRFHPRPDNVEPLTLRRKRSFQWVDNLAPTEPELDELYGDLKFYLGYNGIKWLMACAIYPELNLELTVFLGQNLKGLRKKNLYDRTLLHKIIRLPWFRYGYMPNWLRSFLIEKTDERDKTEIRELLHKLLLTAADRPLNKFELTYAVKNDSLLYLILDAVSIWGKKQPTESPLCEAIFISFVNDSLAFRIHRSLYKIFQKPIIWSDVVGWPMALITQLHGTIRSANLFWRTTFRFAGIYFISSMVLAAIGWLFPPTITPVVINMLLGFALLFAIIISSHRYFKKRLKMPYWTAVALGTTVTTFGGAITSVLYIVAYTLLPEFLEAVVERSTELYPEDPNIVEQTRMYMTFPYNLLSIATLALGNAIFSLIVSKFTATKVSKVDRHATQVKHPKVDRRASPVKHPISRFIRIMIVTSLTFIVVYAVGLSIALAQISEEDPVVLLLDIVLMPISVYFADKYLVKRQLVRYWQVVLLNVSIVVLSSVGLYFLILEDLSSSSIGLLFAGLLIGITASVLIAASVVKQHRDPVNSEADSSAPHHFKD